MVAQGTPEAKIPDNIKYVVGEVMDHKASWGVLRAAAGQHQRHQQNIRHTTLLDALRHMRQVVEKKVQQGYGAELTDEEIWMELKSLGIQLDDTTEKTPKGATPAEEQAMKVCQGVASTRPTIFSFAVQGPGEPLEDGGLVCSLLGEGP